MQGAAALPVASQIADLRLRMVNFLSEATLHWFHLWLLTQVAAVWAVTTPHGRAGAHGGLLEGAARRRQHVLEGG